MYQDDLSIYLKDVRKTTILTRAQEIELAKKIQSGDKAAEKKLILSNLKFVIVIARKYQNMGIPLSDLINEGNYGLVKAAKRFDANTGNKFISYAVWWIRQSILQCLNENSRFIRLPVSLSNELNKLRKVVSNDCNNAQMYPKVTSIEDYLNYSGQTNSYDSVDIPTLETPEKLMVDKELSLTDALESAMANLDDRERYIIREYYLNDETKTLEIIGEELNLTKERIRQIREKALRKIRNNSDLLFGFLE